MPLLTYHNVGIAGISAVVPRKVVKNLSCKGLFTKQEIEKTIRMTGIEERRFAEKDVTTSDLCFEAANMLLDEMEIDRKRIDFLILVTQTPDYRQPTTSTILQHRLGLSRSTGAFDMNLACSGYVYGLSTAFSYASLKDINRILLLAGETNSKAVSPKDRATSLLFGDGGTATLIEKGNRYGKSYFSLNSDGAGENVLKIPGGGYRNPSSTETLMPRKHEDGSVRSDEHLFMDGVEVFKFTMGKVPKDLKRILKLAEMDLDEIDHIIFHQANRFITDHFVKKLKYPPEKVPYSLQRFGNTGSASIPLTIVSEMKDSFMDQTRQVILSGFGGGLSWATCALSLCNCHVSDLGQV